MLGFQHGNYRQGCKQHSKTWASDVISVQNTDFCLASGSNGPTLRQPTPGPEIELVEEYVKSRLPRPPRGQQMTVFLEPEIESGFPDIVAVYWHVGTVANWSTARAELSNLDIRVAHFLAMAGASTLDFVRRFFNKSVLNSLERLRNANIISQNSRSLRLRSLNEVFAVRRLIAIEAKIEQWRVGLHQAVQNTWFASESYLLLPRVPPRSRLLDLALRFGIGVRTCDQNLDISDCLPRRDRIPKSYASWLFNEWVWRASIRH